MAEMRPIKSTTSCRNDGIGKILIKQKFHPSIHLLVWHQRTTYTHNNLQRVTRLERSMTLDCSDKLHRPLRTSVSQQTGSERGRWCMSINWKEIPFHHFKGRANNTYSLDYLYFYVESPYQRIDIERGSSSKVERWIVKQTKWKRLSGVRSTLLRL